MGEKVCGIPWPPGVKKTKQRRAVYSALEQAGRPLTAMELASHLEQGSGAVWLSTIYRILETFEENGMVLRTPVLDSGMSMYELVGGGHRHYAVCVLCSRVIPMENCPMDSFLPRFAEQGFHILGHRLQMYGYCSDCTDRREKLSRQQ